MPPTSRGAKVARNQLEPPRRKSLTVQERVLAWLREALITGTLKPGEWIRQEALSAELGASLIPVREALKTLESEGQVTYAPRRGYYVTELRFEELAEIYEIRRILETEAARRATPHIDETVITAMIGYADEVERFGASADIIDLIDANYEFHFSFYRACQSHHLVRTIGLLWDSTNAYRALYFSDDAARSDLLHRKVISAVESRNETKIVAALDRLRKQALDRLVNILP